MANRISIVDDAEIRFWYDSRRLNKVPIRRVYGKFVFVLQCKDLVTLDDWLTRLGKSLPT
jgi:hypothetical protein